MKKKILFVDDEINLLNGLRRMLRSMRSEWEMAFVSDGCLALDEFRQTQFDVIVSDMRMPEMDGAELLTEVMHRYPSTVRIILSGQCDANEVLKAVGPTHQFISKPCDPDLLKSTVARACTLRDRLGDDSLRELTSQVQALPVLPEILSRLDGELSSDDPSMETIGQLATSDIAITAKALQLVNSAFFGLRREISDPNQAAQLLGIDIIRSLAAKGKFSTPPPTESFADPAVAQHHVELTTYSARVAEFARIIAESEGVAKPLAAHAFIAGKLCEIGRMILAVHLPERYRRSAELAAERGVSQFEAEKLDFGATHADVGGYLLGLWGLPESVVDAVVNHHTPSAGATHEFTPTTAVHVGEFIANELYGQFESGAAPGLDAGYLDQIGMADRLPIWRDACHSHSDACSAS